jgi:hypothetical protein
MTDSQNRDTIFHERDTKRPSERVKGGENEQIQEEKLGMSAHPGDILSPTGGNFPGQPSV